MGLSMKLHVLVECKYHDGERVLWFCLSAFRNISQLLQGMETNYKVYLVPQYAQIVNQLALFDIERC